MSALSITQIHSQLYGKPPDVQAQLLQGLGCSESETADLLNWMNTKPEPSERKEHPLNLLQGNYPFTPEEYQQAVAFLDAVKEGEPWGHVATIEKCERTLHYRCYATMLAKRRMEPETIENPIHTFEAHQSHTRFLMGAPSDLDGASFLNPQRRNPPSQVVQWMLNIFIPTKATFGLVLGAPGSGKSWGGMAWLNHVCSPQIHYGKVQRSDGMVITGYKFSQLYKDAKANKQAIDEVFKKRFLFFDELGTESTQARQELENLINERHRFNRPTLLVSNLGKAEILEIYGGPMLSRLNQKGEYFETTDGDFRRYGG